MIKGPKVGKVVLSDGTSNFRGLRFNIIHSIPTREFSKLRFRSNIMIEDLGSSRRWRHGVNYGKRITETHGLRRDSNSTCIGTRIKRIWIVWDEPRLLDDAIRELGNI